VGKGPGVRAIKHIVATVEEIPPGTHKIVAVAGRSIGVFNIGGEFFALRNSCPHQGGPLCTGRVSGFVIAETPGEYTYSRKGEILRCPWHGWEFDIRTGQSWFDPTKVRVRRYEVTVEPDSAVTTTDAPPAPGLAPGPYVAETYDVSVERQNVIVDIPG
jgi:3-phenylpropionate/trans-cinnamate dioxygenase ferredoxin subunit